MVVRQSDFPACVGERACNQSFTEFPEASVLVKNVDLWQRLEAALPQHDVKWLWVRGHAGHAENERADELARRGITEL